MVPLCLKFGAIPTNIYKVTAFWKKWHTSFFFDRPPSWKCQSNHTGFRGGSRIFERGGSRHGYKIFHKHPPLGHCPRDVIRPQKIWKTPHSWTFTSTPPLDIVRVTSSDLRKFEKHPTLGHSQKGGGPTLGPMLKSLHRGPKGGGPDPLDPPPGSATGFSNIP